MDWCSVYLTPQCLPKYIYLSPPLIFPTTYNGIRKKTARYESLRALLPYVEWDRFVTIAGSKSGLRVTLSYLCGYEPRSCQTKAYTIGICCFSAKNASLRRKSKDWLARNQNNVSEWSDLSTHWLLLAHLAKGNVSFYHQLAPVVRRLSSVYFSHFNLLLWNASAKWSET